MRYDFLSQPISEAEPAGPDPDYDKEFNNQVSRIEGLLPERYYDRAGAKVYDRSSIKLADEVKVIAGLLERSRDIRLLVFDARMQILSGTHAGLNGMAEALQGIAIVASSMWEHFYPQPLDGDMVLRQNAIEGLDDLAVIVPALQYAPVLEGRGRITHRQYLLATGAISAWDSEETPKLDDLERVLKPDERNEKLVAETRSQLTVSRAAVAAIGEALAAIRNIFIEKAGHEAAPGFEKVDKQLRDMGLFLDLYLGVSATAAEGEAGAEDEAAGAGHARLPTGGGTRVPSHGAAAAALKAAERYFLKFEPSSPAVILVHQARMLIGRPLVDALDMLLPEPSTRAVLRFDSGYRFEIDIGRMKHVTSDALSAAEAEPEEETPAADDGWGSSSDSSSDGGWGSSSSETTSSDDGWGSSDSSEEAATESSADPEVGSYTEQAYAEAAAAGEIETDPASEAAAESAAEEPAPMELPVRAPTVDLDTPTNYSAATRAEATLLLLGTETFFKATEPSSAIPTLLAKARAYLNKDFSQILNEIIPRDAEPASE